MEGKGILGMAEYVAFSSYITLQRQHNMASVRSTTPRGSSLKITQRILPSKMNRINSSGFSKLCMRPRLREIFTKCICSVSFVDIDATTTSDWIPIIDQVLLMTSIFLTHMAGVIPVQRPFLPGKNNADDNIPSGSPILTGSAVDKDDRVDSNCALDAVRGKFLDYLDAFERGGNIRDSVLQFEEHPTKRPLSLSAIAEGPRLRLLWASFQRIEEEVNNISSSKTADVDNFLEVFSAFIRKASQPVCMAWLKNEPCLRNGDPDKTIVPLMFEKFREDGNLLQNIKKAGKEDLYAELLHFLSFGSLREGGCFHDHSLFIRHGTSILEDLVVTIADGIACLYLELISVDGNISNDIKGLDLELCSLSTRALQKLRNEVAINQWLYQNAEAVISMYEDRFDLCTFKSQPSEIAEKSAETFSWWTRPRLRRSETTSCPLQYVMIRHLSVPVKRTQELRALSGWRYYFSLLIEFSDITAPLIRAVIDKISSAISFFLVCLIGRSLGLIYTGIRQSLRWK